MSSTETKKRSYETVVQACAHQITVKWWDIEGPVTDEELNEHAEARARECIAKDYSSGELNLEDDKSSARGWWDTRKEET